MIRLPHRAALRTLVFPLAAGLLVGCSVKAPLPSAWTVVPRQAAGEARSNPDGPALGLARFTAAAELRRTDLAWRSDDGRQLHQTPDRWVDYPDRMFEEVVRGVLLDGGAFSAVLPSPPSEGLDAILHVRLLDFTEWHGSAGIEARVSLEWSLRRPAGEVVAQDLIHASAPATERTVPGVVRAQQEAALAAARQLSERVAAALK